MALSNENKPITQMILVGSQSSDLTVPGLYLPKKAKILSAHLMNGANLASDSGTYAKVQLKNGSDIVAEVDTNADGALVANVAKALTVDSTYEEIAAGDSLTAVYDETEYAGVPEISTVLCVADVAGSLAGKYFKLYDELGSVAFWIDVDNAGTSEPVHGATRGVEITTIATGDSKSTVATKIAAVVDADSKFIASVIDDANDDTVQITSSTVGTKTDIVAGDSGFTVAVTQQGAAAASPIALTNAKVAVTYFTY